MLLRKNQGQLFPEEDVCATREEAEDFLEENFAVVVNSVEEVMEFFEEEGLDLDGLDDDSILEAEKWRYMLLWALKVTESIQTVM